MTRAEHLQVAEAAVQEKFKRSMTVQENDVANAMYDADPRLQKSDPPKRYGPGAASLKEDMQTTGAREFTLPGIPGVLTILGDDGSWRFVTPESDVFTSEMFPGAESIATLTDILQRHARASERQTNTQRDVRTEKIMAEKIEKRLGGGIFRNLIAPETEPVTKAAVKEFMPGEGETEIDDVAAALARWAGQSEDATETPVYPATRFTGDTRVPMAADGHPATIAAIVQPYDVTSAGTMAPEYTPAKFLPAGADGNVPEPAVYSPSQPAIRPTGAAAVDFDDVEDANEDLFDYADDDFDEAGEPKTKRAVRMGSGYILKSQFGR